MKPLIIGMGPARSHPDDAWHPSAISTINLCYLIAGNFAEPSAIDRHFDAIDLNRRWHREPGSAFDSVLVGDAEQTLRSLIASGQLRSARKVFLLGEQVTDFVFASLRHEDCPLVRASWRQLPKCVGYRLGTADEDARIGQSRGYYDFVAIPMWHPRALSVPEGRMPRGWQQRAINAFRSAAGLQPVKLSARRPTHLDHPGA